MQTRKGTLVLPFHLSTYLIHSADMPSIGEIFNRAQETVAGHSRCLKDLSAERKKNAEFNRELLAAVNRILLVFKREPAVERLVSFVVSSIVAIGKEDVDFPFLMLEYLLQRAQ